MDNQIISRSNLPSLTLISLLPCLVLGYFSLAAPEPLIRKLEFWYSNPRLVSIWGSSVVHHSTDHLSNNILAYLAAIVPTYTVFALREQLRTLWWTLLALTITTPPLVRAIDWWILAKQLELVAPTATARGFSGIVSAIVGMLLVSSLVTLRDQHGNWHFYRIILLIICLLIGYTAVSSPTVPTATFAVLLIGTIGWVYYQTHSFQEFYQFLKNPPTSDLVTGIAVAIASMFLVAIVPVDILNNGTFTGVIAHIVGLTWGILLATIGMRTASADSVRLYPPVGGGR